MQQVRAAARRTTCRNHLHQLGLSLHNYESTFGVLPPGYVYRPSPQGNEAGFSWGAMILPQLDQASVSTTFDYNVPIFHSNNIKVRETHLPLFLCPDDTFSADGYVEMGSERYASASYVGSFGPPDLDDTQEKRDGLFSRTAARALAPYQTGCRTR